MSRMKKVRFLSAEDLAAMKRKKKAQPQERTVFRTAEWFARTHALMCRNYDGCFGCQLCTNTDETGKVIGCTDFRMRYPAEAVKIVEMWWIKNRERFPEYVRKSDA